MASDTVKDMSKAEADKAAKAIENDAKSAEAAKHGDIEAKVGDTSVFLNKPEIAKTVIRETEPIAVSPTLITLSHAENDEQLEVTELQWLENRGMLEGEGWRHPDEDSLLTDPDGPIYTQARSAKLSE